VCKQVYLVDPSAISVSHVQRGAHRHLVCMRDESCAVSARSCRHQVLLRLHASSGHPGQHAPRRDPQSSGGGSEAARRRPGGRGAAASVSRESSLGHGKKGGFRKGPKSAFKLKFATPVAEFSLKSASGALSRASNRRPADSDGELHAAAGYRGGGRAACYPEGACDRAAVCAPAARAVLDRGPAASHGGCRRGVAL